MIQRAAVLVLLCIVTSAPLTVLSQTGTALKLQPPNASLAEEFTAIGSVRELSDGRVLITDQREGRVVLADLKTGSIQQVGRKGKGPGEYSVAGSLIPLGNDSSLMSDFLARRWLLFSGAEIVVTVPPDNPLIVSMKGFVRGADSDFVVRGHRGTGRLDTVTKVLVAPSRQTVTHNAQGKCQSLSYARPPLSVGEEAVLFADGWFAVARLDPYQVDWISPDGRVAKGKPIPVARIKFSAEEEKAYIERRDLARAASAAAGGLSLPPGMVAQTRAFQDQFPEYFPPFYGGVVAGGDGNLWLKKPVSMHLLDPRYDVVDRTGAMIGTLTLGKDERIVTVSPTAIYVVWKDQDDIERLRRHPWKAPMAKS